MIKPFKLIAGAIIALGIVGFAAAQDAGPAAGAPPAVKPPARHKNFMSMARDVLEKMTLTDAEKAQIKDLYKDSFAKVKEIQAEAKTSTDPAAMKAKRGAFVKEFRENLFKILTPEQVTEFKSIHKQLVKEEEDAQNKPVAKP